MKKIIYILSAVVFVLSPNVYGQSLKKPDVPEPSLKLYKTPKYHINRAGSMGLFDMNFSLGYINKIAAVKTPGLTPVDISTTGQYGMFRLQEGVLSNYFLAKKYKRNKRVKLGLQNTFDLGMRRGATGESSTNFSAPTTSQAGNMKFFFNYQAAGAAVVRITSNFDIGYSYYFYSRTIFNPENSKYSKVRIRYGHLMGEYSFGGMSAVDIKYIKSGRLYFGLSYTKNNQIFTNTGLQSSDVQTNWYQLSIGRVF